MDPRLSKHEGKENEKRVKEEPPDEESTMDIDYNGLLPPPIPLPFDDYKLDFAADFLNNGNEYFDPSNDYQAMDGGYPRGEVKEELFDAPVKKEAVDVDAMMGEYGWDFPQVPEEMMREITDRIKADPDFVLKVEEDPANQDIAFFDHFMNAMDSASFEKEHQKEPASNLYDFIKMRSAARRKAMEEKRKEDENEEEEEEDEETVEKVKKIVKKKRGRKGKAKGGRKPKGAMKMTSDVPQIPNQNEMPIEEQGDPTKRARKKKIPYDPTDELSQSKRKSTTPSLPVFPSTDSPLSPSPSPPNHRMDDEETFDRWGDDSTVPLGPPSFPGGSPQEATQVHKYSALPILSLPSAERIQQRKIQRGEGSSQMVVPKNPLPSSRTFPTTLRDPRRRPESMEKVAVERGGGGSSNDCYDPRRVQKKPIETFFSPHPPQEDGYPRLVCGPIPLEVSLDEMKDRFKSLHSTSHFTFTRFEGNIFMWLRFADTNQAFSLLQSRPFRMGSYSPAIYRPGAVQVEVNSPVGDYYLLTVLSKYGQVIGMEKLAGFKWLATYLEEIDAMRACNQKREIDGKFLFLYFPVKSTHRVEPVLPARNDAMGSMEEEFDSPASPDPMVDYPASPDADSPASPPRESSPHSIRSPSPSPHSSHSHPLVSLPISIPDTRIAIPQRAALVPLRNSLQPLMMVRRVTEMNVERKKGEGMALFPLVDQADCKECIVGMQRMPNHLLLGPLSVHIEGETARRIFEIQEEISVKMIGTFVYLHIEEDASNEARMDWWRLHNSNLVQGGMVIDKGIPRSMIVEATSLHSTVESIKNYFQKFYGTVVSVSLRQDSNGKLFAVNFMNRKDAVNAWNRSIHFSEVNGGTFVLCEVAKT